MPGEFEFDDLYHDLVTSDNSNIIETSEKTLIITMLLLCGLMVTGTVIMLNLIVAFIITDIPNLLQTSRDQVIINQVRLKFMFCR